MAEKKQPASAGGTAGAGRGGQKTAAKKTAGQRAGRAAQGTAGEGAAGQTAGKGARSAGGAAKSAAAGGGSSSGGGRSAAGGAKSTGGAGRSGTRGSSTTGEGGAKGGRGSGTGSGGGRSRRPDLKKDLREFASARPQGWGHQDWVHFLESLQSRGHDVQDRDSIGLALEKERLDLALNGVKGVTAQKRKALVERFGTLWNLRNAPVEDIASGGGVDRQVAERLKTELR